ncbi:DUF1295 domain-containing protein [Stackebrandtia albiflava]
MTALHAAAVGVAAWFLFAGTDTVAAWFGTSLPHADPMRRYLLITLSVVYFVRFLVTTFVTLKRRMAVTEAVTVGCWVIVIHATMAFTGGVDDASVGVLTWAGVVLYVLGSCINTGAELQRMRWKARPENRGRLYTEGLFRYTMHPNYLGDVTLFTGFALVTGSPWALVIPAIMAAMFVFVNIPMLDRYLAERYGDAFTRYASRTAKLIPFVY